MKKITLLLFSYFLFFAGLFAQGPIVKYFGDNKHNYYPLLLNARPNGDYLMMHRAAFFDSTGTIYLDISPTGNLEYGLLNSVGDAIWTTTEKEGAHYYRPVLLDDKQELFTLMRSGNENSSCNGILSWLPIWAQTQYAQMNQNGVIGPFKALNPECVAVFEDAVSLPDGHKLMVTNREDNSVSFYPDEYAQILELNHDNVVTHAESHPDRFFNSARLVKRDDCSFLMAYHENGHLKVSVLSQNGQILDTKQFNYSKPYKFMAHGNGSFTLLSYTSDNRSLLSRLDKDGNILWNKYFVDNPIVDLTQLNDQSLLLLFNNPDYSFGLFQMDDVGNLVNKRSYSVSDTAALAYYLATNQYNASAISGRVGFYNGPTLNHGPSKTFLLLDSIPWTSAPNAPSPASVQLMVYEDINQNCLFDSGEPSLLDWNVQIDNGIGSYQIPGGELLQVENADYDINLVSPPGEWAICPYNNLASITGDTSIYYGVRNLCQTVYTQIDTTHCPANYFNIYGQYCEPGINEFRLSTITGCDSIVTINLIVLPRVEKQLNLEFCHGDSITYNGLTYSNSEMLIFHYSLPGYCDSVLRVNLIEKPETYTQNYSICNNPPLQVNNHTYTQPGVYLDTLSSYLGCDSILVSTLKPTYYNRYLTFYICPGDSVTVNNQVFTQPTTIQDTISIVTGCDTIITTQIYYNNITKYQTINICKGDSYLVGSSIYTEPGWYTDLFTTVSGCDSLVYTTLNWYNPVAFFNFTINPGQVIQNGGVSYYSPGTYIDTLVSIHGCDSIVTTSIHWNKAIEYHNVNLCENPIYTYNGQIFTAPAIICDTFYSCAGFDSVYYLTLIKTYSRQTQIKDICPGYPVTVGNSIYDAPGTYYDTIPGPGNCDIIQKTIVEWGDKTTNITVRLCPGQSIVVGNTPYSDPGSYNIYLETWQGCDSVVRLTITDYYSLTKSLYLCNGDTLHVNGHTITGPTSFSDTLSSVFGCDSILRYNVYWNTKTKYLSPKICPGASFQVANSVYTVPGVYRDTLSSYLGCDSIITTNLTWNNKSKTSNQMICPGQEVHIGASVYSSPGNYVDTFSTWLGCDSIVFTNIQWRTISTHINEQICNGGVVWISGKAYTMPGTYKDTLSSWLGCDSILSITICHPSVDFETSFEQSICTGDSVWWAGQVYWDTGLFTDTFSTTIGCDSIVHMQLTVLPTYSDSVQLSVPAGFEFLGNVIQQDTMLVIQGSSSFGCDSITTYLVEVLSSTKEVQAAFGCRIFPNPNSGQFDLQFLTVMNFPLEISIYSTQGELVFRKEIRTDKTLDRLEIPDALNSVYRIQVMDRNGNAWGTNVFIFRS